MSTSSDKPDEPALRKPFQYSLRSLFLVVTALAVCLGLFKWYHPPVALAAFVVSYLLSLVMAIVAIKLIWRKVQRVPIRLVLLLGLIVIWGVLWLAIGFITLWLNLDI
jgi:hypothetical protein